MPEASSISTPPDDRRLCPACDYDLQGNTTGRCPECGTQVGLGPISRVPWVHRAHRGERRAFLETMRLLLFSPAILARETRKRIHVSHARRFHRESILLATIFIGGALTIVFLMRGPNLEALVFPDMQRWISRREVVVPLAPPLVFADSLLMLAPMLAWVFLSLHASMWIYRRIFAFTFARDVRGRLAARRASRLAYYGSGMLPIIGLGAGVSMVCLTAAVDTVPPVAWWTWVWISAGSLLGALVVAYSFYGPTLVLLRRGARARWPRLLFMGLVYPLLAAPAWLAIGALVFWGLGYLVILAWSVGH